MHVVCMQLILQPQHLIPGSMKSLMCRQNVMWESNSAQKPLSQPPASAASYSAKVLVAGCMQQTFLAPPSTPTAAAAAHSSQNVLPSRQPFLHPVTGAHSWWKPRLCITHVTLQSSSCWAHAGQTHWMPWCLNSCQEAPCKTGLVKPMSSSSSSSSRGSRSCPRGSHCPGNSDSSSATSCVRP